MGSVGEITSPAGLSADDARTANQDYRELPVIDLGPLRAGALGALEATAAQWRQACENLGFLCIVNHGIEASLINEMDHQARRFHDALTVDQKMSIQVTRDQKGYIPSKATIITHSPYHAHTKLDSVECFVVATDFPANDPRVINGTQFYGPTPWPPEDVLPGYRSKVLEYIGKIEALGVSLLPVWERALELQPGFFRPFFSQPYCYLRIAKYPKEAFVQANEFGLGAHADTGFMTFLPPASEPGLQILDQEKKWFWPVVPNDAIIVNIGQFLSRWSNDRFRATPHRVLPPKDNDRYSFACFVNTNLEAVAECLPSCRPKTGSPKYPAQSYWSFFEWYMKRTYVHYSDFSADTPRP
jgi:isopenicillin N synthase-like dioxygenase